jgi:hypothetical protein
MADECATKPVNSVRLNRSLNSGFPKMQYRHHQTPQRQLISGSLGDWPANAGMADLSIAG